MKPEDILKCPFCGSLPKVGHETIDRFAYDITCSGEECNLAGVYFDLPDWQARWRPESEPLFKNRTVKL